MDNFEPLYYLVPTPGKLNEKFYTAELWKFVKDRNVSDGATLFIIASGSIEMENGPVVWPLIEDEMSITNRLHSISKRWAISVLTNAAPALDARIVTSETAISYEDLVAAEANKKALAAAKTAMDIAMGIKTKRTKTTKKSEVAPSHGGRGRGGHGKGKGNPARGRGKGRGKDDGVEEGAFPPDVSGKKNVCCQRNLLIPRHPIRKAVLTNTGRK